jgi:hypothetical protein
MPKKDSKQPNAGAKEITFKCDCCGQYKKIEDMRTVSRFFPLLIVCPDCEVSLHW